MAHPVQPTPEAQAVTEGEMRAWWQRQFGDVASVGVDPELAARAMFGVASYQLAAAAGPRGAARAACDLAEQLMAQADLVDSATAKAIDPGAEVKAQAGVDEATQQRRARMLPEIYAAIRGIELEAGSDRTDLASALFAVGLALANHDLGPAAVAAHLADLTRQWAAKASARPAQGAVH